MSSSYSVFAEVRALDKAYLLKEGRSPKGSSAKTPRLKGGGGYVIPPGQLHKHWDQLYPLLVVALGSPKRAEMAREVLWWQTHMGACYLGARRIAGNAFANKRTWGRCLAQLKALGLARVVRLHRLNGKEAVNLVDLRMLWRRLVKLLGKRMGLTERVGRRLWVKIAGVWISGAQIALPGLAPGGLGSSPGP